MQLDAFYALIHQNEIGSFVNFETSEELNKNTLYEINRQNKEKKIFLIIKN